MASFKKYGHRGACGHAPENTLLSMQKALDLGVDGFEFDIQLSKDGEPMVIHDDTLERTTNGSGAVADFTARELKDFDAGKGQHIPHLDEVFQLTDRRCELVIELKCEAAKQVVHCIESWVSKGWSYDQVSVVSFNYWQLAEIRRINANIRTGANLVAIPLSLAAIAQEAGAISLNPGVHYMNQALVDDAHKRGLKVYTWTANDAHTIAKAKALGVDGIFSDFPERL